MPQGSTEKALVPIQVFLLHCQTNEPSGVITLVLVTKGEQMLAVIWCKIFVLKEKLGSGKSFFDLTTRRRR